MAGTFTIFPAIDLRAGKVVRLSQGDPSNQTIYEDGPLTWGERWKAEGAQWLHIVNLDGAFGYDSSPNLSALKSILTIGLDVEFGGGLRDRDSISTIFDLGVKRIFLGTAAVQDPALAEWAIAHYGSSFVAGDIGIRDGKVVIKGWQETTDMNAIQLGQRFQAQGMEWCVLTDVGRDGTGNGIDPRNAQEFQRATGLQVVASGGVHNIEDVNRVRSAGLAGVIIGRALYEGTLSLRECLQSKDK